jgi:protein LTV1
MGKKKPFIDRKHASTYQLLHRSQRDVSQDHLPGRAPEQQQKQLEGGGDDNNNSNTNNNNHNGMILWPSPSNQASTNDQVLGSRTGGVLEEWRATLAEAGLLATDDNNDVDRYLKDISGTGTFVTPQGRVTQAAQPFQQQQQDWDMLEVKGAPQLDNIALAEALDEDMAAMLYGDVDVEDGDFEELNDEFILDAAKEPEDHADGGAFDYDAHIRQLLEKAKKEREGDGTLEGKESNQWARQDHDFFATLQPLRERPEGDDDEHDPGQDSYGDDGTSQVPHTPGIVSALSPDAERALCEKFEQTLLEYDSDEIGDNPYEEIGGDRPLQGDLQLEAALDDFLAEKEDDILIHGNPETMAERRRGGGSGYSVLVGKQMIPAKDLEENPALVDAELGDLPPAQVVLAAAQARLAEPYVRPPAEDVLIDGQSYFSERVRNPWDCESILSTYSNLDNNPVTIGTGSSRRRRKASKKKPSMEDPVQQIQLSAKTGLPLGVFSSKANDDDDEEEDESQFYDGSTMMSVNRGVARYKNETAEEKRARKAALKQERQMARIQKKVTREVFQEEFAKRSVSVHADDVAGKTVFRYS